MIANLGMYDLPEIRPSTDALWAAIRTALADGGIDAPAQLTRDLPLWTTWTSPDLILGQTCGLPYRSDLHDRVTLLGAFDYDLPDTPAGYYHSVLVARTDRPAVLTAFAEARLAINGFDSESGWAAAFQTARAAGFAFKDFLHTGAHAESAKAVQKGRADIAAIDAVTWRILSRHAPDRVAGLGVVARSTPTPGLPLITARGSDAPRLQAAIRSGLDRLDTDHRDALGLRSFVQVPATAYLSVPLPDLPSQAKARPRSEALQSVPFSA